MLAPGYLHRAEDDFWLDQLNLVRHGMPNESKSNPVIGALLNPQLLAGPQDTVQGIVSQWKGCFPPPVVCLEDNLNHCQYQLLQLCPILVQ
jgi:hypothetical protein